LISNGCTVAFGTWSQAATAQPWRIIPTNNWSITQSWWFSLRCRWPHAILPRRQWPS